MIPHKLKTIETPDSNHLTGIHSLTAHFTETLLDKAQFYADLVKSKSKLPQILDQKVILGLFIENSTRTRLSFEFAAKRLGGDFILMTADGSSLKKGESDFDTCTTLNAYAPDALITRHPTNGFADFAADIMSCPVLNAGDGTAEHPTQALLDALTLRQHFGGIDGLTVTICGDTLHSRVAHSNALLLTMLGAKVRFISPKSLLETGYNVAQSQDFEDALADSDAVMMLRVQKERLSENLEIDFEDYIENYQLTARRLALCPKHCMLLHPGPMNRGIEITDKVAAIADRSLITRQAENGVYTRMACLDLLLT